MIPREVLDVLQTCLARVELAGHLDRADRQVLLADLVDRVERVKARVVIMGVEGSLKRLQQQQIQKKEDSQQP
jgi:hypothetical protein